MGSAHVLTIKDIVKFKKPYRPEELVHRKPKDWKGFEYIWHRC